MLQSLPLPAKSRTLRVGRVCEFNPTMFSAILHCSTHVCACGAMDSHATTAKFARGKSDISERKLHQTLALLRADADAHGHAGWLAGELSCALSMREHASRPLRSSVARRLDVAHRTPPHQFAFSLRSVQAHLHIACAARLRQCVCLFACAVPCQREIRRVRVRVPTIPTRKKYTTHTHTTRLSVFRSSLYA